MIAKLPLPFVHHSSTAALTASGGMADVQIAALAGRGCGTALLVGWVKGEDNWGAGIGWEGRHGQGAGVQK